MNVIAVGAGFSGSLMAILLGRQGCTVTVVDRYEIYPAEFCAEQLVAIDDVHGAKRCVSLEDGSTLIEHWIGVPADVATVREAVAWTFGISEHEYQPIRETWCPAPASWA